MPDPNCNSPNYILISKYTKLPESTWKYLKVRKITESSQKVPESTQNVHESTQKVPESTQKYMKVHKSSWKYTKVQNSKVAKSSQK